ncbi:MAG: translocation/assembly module TamB domain-containing protein [Pseudomonadota bacterium]|nr:translocation/assembly module TamB domain-containing protein [Pseudomonadota bacterium]
MAEVTATGEDDIPRDGGEQAVVVRSGNRWRRFAEVFALGLLGLLTVAALLVALLDTGPGRRLVVDQIEGLEFENGMRIGIDRIDGSLYGEATIHGLTLYDPKGAFLRVPTARVDWRPFKYMRNHIDIRSLYAPEARLLRLPEFDATPPSEGPLLPDFDIDVGRFKIDRLIVERPVTGERRVGSVEGAAKIADGRAQVRLNGMVVGGDGRAGGDRVALALDAVPEENRLALNLFLRAPRGGVLARMAGLDEPLAVRVTGRGDWSKWDGRLAAELGGAPFARLALSARDGTFGVRGQARASRLLGPGIASNLLGRVTNVNLRSTWENRRADLNGRLSSDAFQLVANGGVDLGRNRFNGLRINFALLKPTALAPNLAGRDVRGLVTLDGAMAKPDVDYSLAASRIAFGDTGLIGLRASGKARFREDHVAVPLDARVRAITGLDTVAGGTLANVRINGDLAVDWPRILSDNLRIRSDRIDATALVVANVSTGLYTGALDGRIDDYRIDGVGIFNIQTDADLRSTGSGLSLVGTVRARSTRLFNESVRDFLGGNLTAAAQVRYAPDGAIRFSSLRLSSPKLRISEGSGSYDAQGRISIRASGASQDYGPVSVSITGTAAQPNVTIKASRPGLGLGITGLDARVRSTGNGYAITTGGMTDYGRFSADVVVRTAAGPLTIDIRRATIADIDLSGTVRQTPAGPFTGRLDARGNGLAGLVRLAAVGRFQELLINLRARDAVLPQPANIAVGAAKIDARVILYDRPEIVADAQIADAQLGSLEIAALRAIVDYRGGRGTAKMIAEGRSGVPFRVAMNSELRPDLWRAALAGRVNGVDFRTAAPARILPRGNTYELLPTQVEFDDGSLRLAGRYGRELKLLARLDSVNLRVVNSFSPGLGIGGRATGAIQFEQAGSALPSANVRLAVRDFTRTTAASVSQPMHINLVAALEPSRASLRAVMRTRGTVVGRVQAFADPLGAGRSWTERVALAPVSGGIRYLGPANALFSFSGLADQSLDGPLAVAADLRCRVSEPCLQGIVRGRGLEYRNLTYGTRLTGMSLTGRFTGERLEIQQLSAQAGEGTVTGSGYVSLAASRGYPANFDLRLNQARLASSEDLRVTASGNLQLVKAANQQPVLRGTIQLPSTRYRIVRQGAAQVPTLTGVRFKPPRGRQRVSGEPEPSATAGSGDLRLDLDVVAPNELFISGMGLESEWRANINVTGSAANPRIAGQAQLIRGTLGFAGRSFELTTGQIRFLGGDGSNAVIALSAEEAIEDVEVAINVTGSVTNPQIRFTSTPGLPQDEIVSRILFGNSVGSLSTIQAVQLAASLNSLRGSGGGLNPLGKLRSATGFDRLRILGGDETEGRGTALAAGKYITNDVYLEIVTDARGFTATQLEIALSRSLSVLSQAGGTSGTNATVRYRKTY